MTDAPELFRFDAATISRADGVPVLRELTWRGSAGTSWAVVGPNGCGKTTLLEALAGRHRLTTGERTIPPSDAIAFVGFREQSRLFSPADFYYQQRFEFNEPDDCPTAREYLTADGAGDIGDVVSRFRLAGLLDLKLLKLSNGQQRRLRIARGVLKHPSLLLLDDPFSGLDTASRHELDLCLGRIPQDNRTVVLACRPDSVPTWVTNVLELGSPYRATARKDYAPPEQFEATVRAEPPALRSYGPPVVEMRGVTVRHGGRAILTDVDWTVRRGERWAVLGPNGSGKTTLLSLLCGDHPQAFANDIRLFGARRGGGETIWEVKKRVGLVSPEMHQYFPRMLTARDAVASGFCDRFAPERLTATQETQVDALLGRFTLSVVAGQAWWRLSTGTQRLLLFLRAVVKRPELLILDEPFQAIDAETMLRVRAWLSSELSAEQTLLLVVHDTTELPAGMTHRLRLDGGRVVERE